MSGPWLTVDLGNSRCKLCLWSESGAVLATDACAVEEPSTPALESFFASHPRAGCGVLSSVASDADRARWEAALRSSCTLWLGTQSDSQASPASSDRGMIVTDTRSEARSAVESTTASGLRTVWT